MNRENEKIVDLRKRRTLNGKRAFFTGALGGLALALWIDCFNMAGLTPFSMERYLGTLLTRDPSNPHSWTLGFFMNLIVGGVFGILYAFLFEYVFKEASPRRGIHASIVHLALAGFGFFPLFGLVHDQVGTHLYPMFGFLGFLLNPGTPALLAVGHTLYGVLVGTLYGPVRTDRLRARLHEPGESGRPGEPDVLTDEEDPIDRASGY